MYYAGSKLDPAFFNSLGNFSIEFILVADLTGEYQVTVDENGNIKGWVYCKRVNHWVEKDEITDKYKLGIYLFELNNIVREGFQLREMAIPYNGIEKTTYICYHNN